MLPHWPSFQMERNIYILHNNTVKYYKRYRGGIVLITQSFKDLSRYFATIWTTCIRFIFNEGGKLAFTLLCPSSEPVRRANNQSKGASRFRRTSLES